MEIRGKNALILGGFGLVGNAVCRELLAHEPARIVVASLREAEALQAVKNLKAAFPGSKTELVPAWGNIFQRSDWAEEKGAALSDAQRNRQLTADIIGEMDEDILSSSLLTQLIRGEARDLGEQPAHIVVDCINTSTAVAYQDIFATARHVQGLIDQKDKATDWSNEIQLLLSTLYIPQLVRHVQIMHEAMIRAGTQAYIKVGTAGTGGMGLNIPYTHGEEKPSRVLMSKAALAGAQTLLTFLMARTPGGPQIVKEIKPAALIAWKEITFGPIQRAGAAIKLYDCLPENAVSIADETNLVENNKFGEDTGEVFEAVYINTGENGLFAAGDFAAITALGQMEFVTPEEIAINVVREILGGNTGKDIVSALDGAVMGPTFRAGTLRDAALKRLKLLGEKHGESVAFELLGPPRMSKLLYEAFLLKNVYSGLRAVQKEKATAMAEKVQSYLNENPRIRQQIISIGLPILLSDGKNILRGPEIKSENAFNGWVDLTPENMAAWKKRIDGILFMLKEQLEGDTSSRYSRNYPTLRDWVDEDRFEIGEMVAWISINEDSGKRGKK